MNLLHFLQVTRTTVKSAMNLNVVKFQSPITKLAALEHLKNLMNSLVTTLVPLFLIGSFPFLQVTRTTIKSQMCLKFCQIRPLAVELAALERQEKS